MDLIMRFFCISFVLSYAYGSVAGEAPKNTKIASSGTSSGTFKSLMWSDYPYLDVLENGNLVTYVADKGPWSVFEEYSEKLRGIKVKVSWVKINKYFPELRKTVPSLKTTDICSYSQVQFTSTRKQKISVCKK